MTNFKTFSKAEQAAKTFFVVNFNYTSGVGYEKKGNVYSFYSKDDSAMDDTFDCTIGE